MNEFISKFDQQCYVIAEAGLNHNGSLKIAKELIDVAYKAKANAVKFQKRTISNLATKSVLEAIDSRFPEFGNTYKEIREHLEFSADEYKYLKNYSEQKGLDFIVTAFDIEAVDFLEDLNVPAYKIASFENNYIPLIEKAASTGKPLIISTGLASLGELEAAVGAARSSGCKEIVLLKCTSTYPASPLNTNISTIPHLRNLFGTEVGLSDHTLGTGVSVASVALGSSVIEKHFTLSRDDGGVDSTFSLEPSEFKILVEETFRAWQSLGNISYGPTDAEQKSLAFRRSIYVSQDIEAGEIFTEANIRIVRPGYGAPPHLYSSLIGRVSRVSYKRGTPLSLDALLG